MNERADAYEEHLRRKNLSPRSVTQWTMIVRRASDWFGRDIADATRDDIERWLFVDQPHLAPASQRNYLKGLKSYYTWLIREGELETDPTVGVVQPKEPTLMPDPVRPDEVRRALDAASPMMRAMIALAAFCGMRCAEISALQWGDIDAGGVLIRGKGRKQRRVPLHPEAAAAIAALRDGLPSDRVFGWSPEMVSQHGCQYLRAIGVDVRRPMHGLRSFYATQLYAATGHDLLLVRDMLGHESVQTTARYAQVDINKAASAVASIAA